MEVQDQLAVLLKKQQEDYRQKSRLKFGDKNVSDVTGLKSS